MGLSEDLISQFVKATKDANKTKRETTVYGTIVEDNGVKYVQLDGSNTPTPISSTASANVGDRVTVLIKDHTAIITGNTSSPSARSEDVNDIKNNVGDIGNQITEMEIAIADKVDTKQLNAEKARIDVLQSENVTIKNELTAQKADITELSADNVVINEKLVANDAEIEKLQTEKLNADIADLTYATISELDATNANLHNLESTYGSFASLTAEQLEAMEAAISKLEAGEITVDQLKAIFATIEQLNVEKARIDDLEAEVGDIDTLIFGSATGETIQTSFANAVIAQLGNAQIKSAMIESMAADKITSGDIITNNVRVMSEDGKLLISDETIQISDNARVRVQIGKDAAGDYSINIWDAEGNLMFSEGGITDSAIKEAIIRNDMVSDTANIAAHKLDIDSLFEEINGSTKTIKSTRIYLDDEKQTLDVAFESMSSDIEEIQNGVTTQGTQITAMQGQIASKVWQQDINTAVNEVNETTDNLSTQYEEIVQDVNGLTATVANHTSELEKKADSTEVTEVSDKVTSLEVNLGKFQTTVSETYATKNDLENTQTEFNDLTIGGRNYFIRGNINNLAWGSADDEHPNGRILENQYYRGFSFPVVEGEEWCLHRTEATNNRWGVYWLDVEPALDVGAMSCAFRNDTQAANVANYLIVPTGATWGFIYLSNNINEGDIPNIMLEKSTKPSDWRPAPEDVDADVLAVQEEVVLLEERISNAETSISQNIDAISLRATKTELTSVKSEVIAAASADAQTKADQAKSEAISAASEDAQEKANQAKADAVSTASADAQTKADKALSDANTNTANMLKSYSTTTEMEAAITTSADSIKSSVKATYATIETVEGIDIGGRNYYRPSQVVDLGCTGLASGEQSLISTGSCIGFYIPVVAGDIWTISRESTANNRFDYCFTVDEPASGVLVYGWSQAYRESLEIVGIEVPEGYNYLFLYLSNQNDDMPNIKLEKGNKVTDWTPAPEDMATADEISSVESSIENTEERITTTETLIQQLSDSISMLVTDGNGQSLMTQTDDGWTFSTGDIQDKINSASENLDALTNEVGDIDSAVGILQQAVDDLGVLSEYVKITTYEGEPCIELGETDSDFKLLITNTRIMFMEGTGVPAYINNQSLHIKKAVIEQELQQGEFVWKARSNGNLGLIWKGATN